MTTSQRSLATLPRRGERIANGPDYGRLSFWERGSFTVAHAVTRALWAALSLPGLYRFGRLFGTLEWLINYKRRRRFAQTHESTLGHKPTPSQRRRATREFFCRTRCDKLFYLILDCIPRETALQLFHIENKQALDTALQRGRGAYLALSHHGPHHVCAMMMTLLGYKVAGVRDRREGGIRRFIQDRFNRRRSDVQRMRMLFADGYPRDIYRCFQQGYVLGSAMDVARIRGPHQKTEEVTIFGERRRFLSGPMRVAIRCKTPVFQGFLIGEHAFHYRLDLVETLIDPDECEDKEKMIGYAMQRYAVNVEQRIRAMPALITRI